MALALVSQGLQLVLRLRGACHPRLHLLRLTPTHKPTHARVRHYRETPKVRFIILGQSFILLLLDRVFPQIARSHTVVALATLWVGRYFVSLARASRSISCKPEQLPKSPY
jgi:hypothetical protein